jgi:hypothetical protein
MVLVDFGATEDGQDIPLGERSPSDLVRATA